MDTGNLKFLSIENGTLCNEEIDEGENFENSEMKPKNFKIFIYIFQCNVTKAKNFEENFKDFTTNLSNSKKYKELQYINSYFTTWQRNMIGKSKKKFYEHNKFLDIYPILHEKSVRIRSKIP